MAITKPEKEKINPQEVKLLKARAQREEAVRKILKRDSNATKIVVSNVYDDAYRVNYYSEVNGEQVAIKTFRIVDSKFIRMKVEARDISEN